MVELEEIQSLLIDGFRKYSSACYMLFQVNDAKLAKNWLQGMQSYLAYGVKPSDEWCINLAFSYPGLEKLGLQSTLLSKFPTVFSEGMVSTYRQRILGDIGDSSPECWQWGYGESAVDLLFLVFARNDGLLVKQANKVKQEAKKSGVNWLKTLHTEKLPENKEHFGFRDGISQPKMSGVNGEVDSNGADSKDSIAPGEFILGYPNEHQGSVNRLTVSAASDPSHMLPGVDGLDNAAIRDFSKNGSYLVFRQLRQNVKAFWDFMAKNASKGGESRRAEDYASAIKLASKMVGRWPSGAPLMKFPDIDPVAVQDKAVLNRFSYKHDPSGLSCPIGAHIRRAHPRNAFTFDKSCIPESVRNNKRHRILRRGRSYGKPFSHTMNPVDMIKSREDQVERGLYFICLNADIERQFEFIQQAWLNNKKYGGLYNEVDPLVGKMSVNLKADKGTFTVPADPIRTRYFGLKNFVEMRGGGYFFLPSRAAVDYIIHHGKF